MTKGEYRVGTNFNPLADDKVGQIQRLGADLIDLIDRISVFDVYPFDEVRHAEVERLKALAQTAIENGAMWAVNAATKPPL